MTNHFSRIPDLTRAPSLHVGIDYAGEKFDGGTKICSVGSCFAEEITTVLSGAGLAVSANPNGILYNPCSIAETLERMADGKPYLKEELFEFNGLWHSFLHHGSFSCGNMEDTLEKCNQAFFRFSRALEECDLMLVTLSSAVVYVHNGTGRITANCHKLSNGDFTRRLLSHSECAEACRRILSAVRRKNRKCTVIFTVSPVRHYPGDPVLNSVSKARIRSSAEEVLNTGENVLYFPAYEIVNDELRDYRFYAEDMVHLSPLAVRIVTDTFLWHFFTAEVGERVRASRAAERKAGHRPNHPDFQKRIES